MTTDTRLKKGYSKMAINTDNKGFTLVEMIVVITLASLMVTLALPNFKAFIIDQSKEASNWIILTVKHTKQSAVKNQKTYTLHIDVDANKMWYTMEEVEAPVGDEDGEETDGDAPKALPEKNKDQPPKEYALPEGYNIRDVAYSADKIISSGEAAIECFKKGYSDRAVIHIDNESEEKMYSYLIEPFLMKVKMFDGYLELE